MRPTLHLNMARDRVGACSVQGAGRFAFGRRARTARSCVESFDARGLHPSLEAVAHSVADALGGISRGAHLKVALGSTYCRLQAFELGEAMSGRLPDDELDAVVRTWISTTMGLEVEAHEIRWTRTQRGKVVLVSCVETQVLSALRTMAQIWQVKLVQCRSALAQQMEQHRGQKSEVILYTEDDGAGARSPIVQLVLRERGEVQYVWRGWTPAVPLDDRAWLDDACRRFQGGLGVEGVAVRDLRWNPSHFEAVAPR